MRTSQQPKDLAASMLTTDVNNTNGSLLSNSDNRFIRSLNEKNWIYDQADSSLERDVEKNVLINGELFSESNEYKNIRDNRPQAKTVALHAFIKRVLFKNEDEKATEENITRVINFWQQSLPDTVKNTINSAFESQNLNPVLDYVANIKLNNEQLLEADILHFNIRLVNNVINKDNQDHIPGYFKTHFIEEKEKGIKLDSILASNPYLSEICKSKDMDLIDKNEFYRITGREGKKIKSLLLPTTFRKKLQLDLQKIIHKIRDTKKFDKIQEEINKFNLKNGKENEQSANSILYNIPILSALLLTNPDDVLALHALNNLYDMFDKDSKVSLPLRHALDKIKCEAALRRLQKANEKERNPTTKQLVTNICKEVENTTHDSIATTQTLTAILNQTNYLITYPNEITEQDKKRYYQLADTICEKNSKLSNGMLMLCAAVILASVTIAVISLGTSLPISLLGITAGLTAIIGYAAVGAGGAASSLGIGLGIHRLFKPNLRTMTEKLVDENKKAATNDNRNQHNALN